MSSLEFQDHKGLKRPLGSKPPLIVIVGPTAVGKTEISIQLAERLGGEIVSADSRLFYRGMDIGTAKPTSEERLRIPHHLIDVADPDETWSLAVFQRLAAGAIADIHARGRLPFLVGGTGQYIHAVTHGWAPPATEPDARLRAVLEGLAKSQGNDWLHQRLALLDPPAAQAIDPRNLRRTVRALEVIFSTGCRFSDQRGQGESPYRLLTIGLIRPRPELYARVDARIEAMFAAGLLDEVRSLLALGYSPDLPTMSAIGYRECAAVLRGEMSLEGAKVCMRRLTRIFVRRQANWFKAEDAEIHWFEAGEAKMDEIEKGIRAFLK
ncbi:MAG TPA: tRNA (adenosine(37)-N6)-dimethylallyltransferase MiaA [Anaerolineales bacterium]